MQYTVVINQAAYMAHFPGLRMAHIAIVDWFTKFTHSPKIKKLIHQGQNYFWMKYEKVLEELPVLGVAKRQLQRIVKQLCEVGILQAHPDNARMGQSFFAFGENYWKTHTTTIPTEEPAPTTKEEPEPEPAPPPPAPPAPPEPAPPDSPEQEPIAVPETTAITVSETAPQPPQPAFHHHEPIDAQKWLRAYNENAPTKWPKLSIGFLMAPNTTQAIRGYLAGYSSQEEALNYFTGALAYLRVCPDSWWRDRPIQPSTIFNPEKLPLAQFFRPAEESNVNAAAVAASGLTDTEIQAQLAMRKVIEMKAEKLRQINEYRASIGAPLLEKL